MGKELSEMTLEELWELFPIFLVAPDARWRRNYGEIEATLRELLSGFAVERISHIGSTAIEGIWAKDIVDVLVELAADEDTGAAAAALEQAGFAIMSNEKDRISLNLGYTNEGFAEKVFHVHLRHSGDNDELYFRDYLNEHPEFAADYEALKLRLWKEFEHDRNAYTEAKTEFIRRYTDIARREYAERY